MGGEDVVKNYSDGLLTFMELIAILQLMELDELRRKNEVL